MILMQEEQLCFVEFVLDSLIQCNLQQLFLSLFLSSFLLLFFFTLLFQHGGFVWTVSSVSASPPWNLNRYIEKTSNNVKWSLSILLCVKTTWAMIMILSLYIYFLLCFLSMMIRVVRVGPECRVLQPFCLLRVRHWWLLQRSYKIQETWSMACRMYIYIYHQLQRH